MASLIKPTLATLPNLNATEGLQLKQEIERLHAEIENNKTISTEIASLLSSLKPALRAAHEAASADIQTLQNLDANQTRNDERLQLSAQHTRLLQSNAQELVRLTERIDANSSVPAYVSIPLPFLESICQFLRECQGQIEKRITDLETAFLWQQDSKQHPAKQMTQLEETIVVQFSLFKNLENKVALSHNRVQNLREQVLRGRSVRLPKHSHAVQTLHSFVSSSFSQPFKKGATSGAQEINMSEGVSNMLLGPRLPYAQSAMLASTVPQTAGYLMTPRPTNTPQTLNSGAFGGTFAGSLLLRRRFLEQLNRTQTFSELSQIRGCLESHNNQ
eukprot:Platyproteum_vivax@DN405_c0_g1_i2.p1